MSRGIVVIFVDDDGRKDLSEGGEGEWMGTEKTRD